MNCTESPQRVSRSRTSGCAVTFSNAAENWSIAACGVPVAAFPVHGPIDVVKDPAVGVLDEDLRQAALAALELDRTACRRYAEGFPWEESCRRFLAHMVPARAAISGRDAAA